MLYAAVKQLHVATVVASWALFFLRGVWMIAESPRVEARWVRLVPHVNDTILLLAGVYLATAIGLQPWIVAKSSRSSPTSSSGWWRSPAGASPASWR